MSCRSVRREMVLVVDRSGACDESLGEPARRHLAVCPACHEFWTAQRATIGRLATLRETPVMAANRSVWPELERRMQSGYHRPARHWKERVSAVFAVGSICAALLAVTVTPFAEWGGDSPAGPATQTAGLKYTPADAGRGGFQPVSQGGTADLHWTRGPSGQAGQDRSRPVFDLRHPSMLRQPPLLSQPNDWAFPAGNSDDVLLRPLSLEQIHELMRQESAQAPYFVE